MWLSCETISIGAARILILPRTLQGGTDHIIVTWCLINRGMMYNGEKVISLWKGKKEDKKETDISRTTRYQCPTSNNSDPKAVQLHINFDSYGFPMYFPSCTSPSWSIVLSQQKNTNVAVRKQFSRLHCEVFPVWCSRAITKQGYKNYYTGMFKLYTSRITEISKVSGGRHIKLYIATLLLSCMADGHCFSINIIA